MLIFYRTMLKIYSCKKLPKHYIISVIYPEKIVFQEAALKKGPGRYENN